MRPIARMRARLRAIRILEPLASRDYRLLTAGSFISLLGDGFFSVALAWQVYEISNVHAALSVVGVAWTLPLVVCLLLGGVLTDRYDRRWLMVGADLVRAAAVGALGLLSITGVIQLWHVLVLIAFMGAGDAFFNPASTAIVPDLLAAERLPQANALQGLVRPLMIRLVGPALGGFVVAVLHAGSAFLIDGATFLLSAAALLAIRTRPSHLASSHGVRHGGPLRDRLDHLDDAAPGAGAPNAARPCLEPGLARLDRPGAGQLRAHRTGGGLARTTGHHYRGRPAGCPADGNAPVRARRP